MFACVCTYMYIFSERYKQSYYSYIENAVEWLRACLGYRLFSLIVPILRHVSFFRLGLLSFYFPPPPVRPEPGECSKCRCAYGSKCERVRYTHRTCIHAPCAPRRNYARECDGCGDLSLAPACTSRPPPWPPPARKVHGPAISASSRIQLKRRVRIPTIPGSPSTIRHALSLSQMLPSHNYS